MSSSERNNARSSRSRSRRQSLGTPGKIRPTLDFRFSNNLFDRDVKQIKWILTDWLTDWHNQGRNARIDMTIIASLRTWLKIQNGHTKNKICDSLITNLLTSSRLDDHLRSKWWKCMSVCPFISLSIKALFVKIIRPNLIKLWPKGPIKISKMVIFSYFEYFAPMMSFFDEALSRSQFCFDFNRIAD